MTVRVESRLAASPWLLVCLALSLLAAVVA